MQSCCQFDFHFDKSSPGSNFNELNGLFQVPGKNLKIKVPNEGRDHFTQRHISVKSAQQKDGRREKIDYELREYYRKNKQLRTQNSLLGAIFAMLALVVYLGTQIAAPKLIVHVVWDGTNRATGATVVVDDSLQYRSDQEIRDLKLGTHKITILPDEVNVDVVPPENYVTVAYKIAPTELTFSISHMDTTKTPD